jgi:phage terminase Nu1 subunit (DNA packaging protein)
MTQAMNATQLAGALARTRQTIHLWVRQGLPRNPDKSFSLPAVISWLVERERDALADQGSPNDSPQLERWRAARAELAELELALRKDQLVTVDHVLDAWCHRHDMVAAALISLVDRLPPMLVGLDQIEMREQIEHEVDTILEGFAQDGRYTPRREA